MLWYYSMEKQEKAAEYGSDLGVSDRTRGWDQKGDTALGYVPTTDEEKINYYKGNINALWDTGDEKWIKKYGEAIFGKGDAFSAAETPDQRRSEEHTSELQ